MNVVTVSDRTLVLVGPTCTVSGSSEHAISMTGHWVCPVRHDRMRPVVIFRFWYLTGNDRTLVFLRPVTLSSASGHYLNVLMTVEIGRLAFEADDTWQASGDRTLRSSVRSPRAVPSEGVQRLYFMGASI